MHTFPSPFSRAYWKDAAAELHNPHMLVLAALVVAARIAVRSITIPISENLVISIEFLPTAVGSMVYGPIVALLSGVASDILGAVLFPRGAFFPPYMLVTVLSHFLFALFLYRAPLSIVRVFLSKLSVNLFCNILLTPIMLAWMSGSAAYIASIPRVVKNITLLPFETLLLFIVLRAMAPVLRRMKLGKA